MSTFVTVGNATQPFIRLLKAVTSLLNKLPQPVIIQYGHTPFSYDGCKAVQFMDMKEFSRVVESAELLIMHAGAGSVIHAVHAGKVPVVMPRSIKNGEHIDNHQQEFARALANTGKVVSAEGTDDLERAIAEALDRQKVGGAPFPQPEMMNMVEEILDGFSSQYKKN